MSVPVCNPGFFLSTSLPLRLARQETLDPHIYIIVPAQRHHATTVFTCRRNYKMPSAVTTQDEPSSIPNIDISPFLKDPHSEAAKAVVSEVRAACKSTGFFLITGHGHSKELQKEAFDAAARFFALPFPDKQKLDVKKNVGFRGYDVLETETFSSGNKPDLKEV